ncbi:hypothetical protein M8C21_032734, partial [Ambrosia artemisiifolia]
MLLVILCVTFLPFAFASINTTCLPSEEVDVLREIGRKLGKDWDFELDPCVEWSDSINNKTYVNNVTCNTEPNNTNICHVTSISLKGQSLAGILPPEFTNLPNLLNLDLARNYLGGTIPPSWGSMQQILNITLIGNRINGSIPKELGNLRTLTTLTVEDNMMSGIIPEELGNLASIERLFLNSNSFSGRLPASFANLTTIKEFRIGGNNFSGKIPDYIEQWKSLESLRIQASGLDGPIPSSITLLESLTDLRISDLGGPAALCPPFGNASFKNLILRNCNLFGNLPDSLPSGALKVLDFSFNKFNGTIPNGFMDLRPTDYIYLTGNLLSGIVPDWMLTSGDVIDLSYNNFTSQNSNNLRCQIRDTNLFASFSTDNTSKEVSCLGNNGVTDGNKEYEGDLDSGGASHFSSFANRWGFSNTGHFLDDDQPDSYILTNRSGVLVNNSELYMNARTSAISLTYYGFCMRNGSYNVSLHFAEIVFTDDEKFSSLGRRVFDIYIQGKLVEKDFDISARAGGVGKAIVTTYTIDVTTSLEIRLYWAGKGTINIPSRGNYGPLISAISVDPNFEVPLSDDSQGNGNGVSGGVVAGIVIGAVCAIILILGLLWWRGCLRCKDPELDLHGIELNGLELNTGSFTLKQIKAATDNFDVANKIGEGGFGSVYKGVLPNGTLIAVKQLSAKSKQGNREICIDIAKGLAFLHEESRLKIVHRDIKATNVLLDKDLNAKISDFGLAKLDEEDNTHISTRVAGTYGYMAPEYAMRGYLTDKADVYSYGIVLLEIVSGAIALKAEGKLMDLVDPKLDSEYDKQEVMVVISLALMCAAISPTERPTMSSVVSMLEGRIVPEAFSAEQSFSMTKTDRDKMMKLLEIKDENQPEEMSFAYTDSSTSAADLYPVNGVSEYLQKREVF